MPPENLSDPAHPIHLNSTDPDRVAACLDGLHRIALRNHGDGVAFLIEKNIGSKLLRFLDATSSSDFQFRALSIYWHILNESQQQVERAVRTGGCRVLIKLIESENKSVAFFAVRVLRDIARASDDSRRKLLEEDIVSHVLRLQARSDSTQDCVVDVANILYTLFSYAPGPADLELTSRCLPAMKSLLVHGSDRVAAAACAAIIAIIRFHDPTRRLTLPRRYITPLLRTALNADDLSISAPIMTVLDHIHTFNLELGLCGHLDRYTAKAIEGIDHENRSVVLKCVCFLRSAVAQRVSTVESILELGAMPKLLRLLEDDDDDDNNDCRLWYRITPIIAQVVSVAADDENRHADILTTHPVLVKMLQSNDEATAFDAARAFTNVAQAKTGRRGVLSRLDILPPLLRLVERNTRESFTNIGLRCIDSLFADDQCPSIDDARPFLQVVLRRLLHESSSVVCHACQTVSTIFGSYRGLRDVNLITLDMINRIAQVISAMRLDNDLITHPLTLLRYVYLMTDILITKGALAAIKRFFEVGQVAARRNQLSAIVIVQNIVMKARSIQMISDSGLLRLILTNNDPRMMANVVDFVFICLRVVGKAQARLLVHQGAVSLIAKRMKHDIDDTEMLRIMNCLNVLTDGYDDIGELRELKVDLQNTGVVEHLKELANDTHNETEDIRESIHEKAESILEMLDISSYNLRRDVRAGSSRSEATNVTRRPPGRTTSQRSRAGRRRKRTSYRPRR